MLWSVTGYRPAQRYLSFVPIAVSDHLNSLLCVNPCKMLPPQITPQKSLTGHKAGNSTCKSSHPILLHGSAVQATAVLLGFSLSSIPGVAVTLLLQFWDWELHDVWPCLGPLAQSWCRCVSENFLSTGSLLILFIWPVAAPSTLLCIYTVRGEVQ